MPARRRAARGLVAVAAIPTLATVAAEAMHLTAPPAWARAALAVPLSAAVAWVIGVSLGRGGGSDA